MSYNIASVCEVAVPGEARVGTAAACGGAASSFKPPDRSRRDKGHLQRRRPQEAGAANTLLYAVSPGNADD